MKRYLLQAHLVLLGLFTQFLRCFTPKRLVLLNENAVKSFDCLGDQATLCGMVAGIRSTDPGAAIVVMSHMTDTRWLEVDGVDRVIGIGKHGSPSRIWKMVFTVAQARRVQYLAGDSVDGKYGLGVRQWAWRYYGLSGTPTWITSFSFNRSPSKQALELIAKLPRATRFLIRDELSIERFSRLTDRSHIAVADAAFMLPPQPEQVDTSTKSFIDSHRAAGRTVVAININRHVIPGAIDRLSVQPTIEATAAAMDQIMRCHPVAWVTLPHDSRGEISDENIAVWLAEAVQDDFKDRVCAAPMMSSGGVKAITSMLDLVVTGRMHLAIASLGSGTPVLAFTYQDKFEGLFAHFGLSGIGLAPEDGMTRERIIAFIDAGLERHQELRERIAEHLPRVQEMARRNAVTD